MSEMHKRAWLFYVDDMIASKEASMQRRFQSRMAALPRLRIYLWSLLLFHPYAESLRRQPLGL
jgi:hypothetical protein